MRKHHPANERIKRQYFIYLEEAKRMAPSSIDQIAAAIAAFEALTKYRDFKKFHIEQARQFKRQLREQINPKTGKPLAKATINTRLKALRAFFIWLAGQPGFRSKLSYSDADYFNDSNHNDRIAAAVREKRVPTIEQIRHVLETMPDDTDIEKRNRALVAFTLLSGARDNAIASLSIKHVDVEKRKVFQDAREVRTKFRKTFTSQFFPVGEDIERIFLDWIACLKSEKLFGPDDPLFPATKIKRGENGLFGPAGLDRVHWKSAGAIRKIFKQAFESAACPITTPIPCAILLPFWAKKYAARRRISKSGARIWAMKRCLPPSPVTALFQATAKPKSWKNCAILTGKKMANWPPAKPTGWRTWKECLKS